MRVRYEPFKNDESYWIDERIIHRDGYQLGVIGCDESCETCDGSTNNDCVFCVDDKLNNFGECVDECDAN